MDGFLRYFFQDMGRIFSALIDVIVAFFQFLNYLLNFPMRMKIIEQYNSEFTTTDRILMLVANIALIIIIVLLFILFGRLMKKIFHLIPIL